MVAILRPWSWAKATRSGRRAMVPSSFMISQITPDGIEPGEPRDIDRGLGMAGAHQHAAVARHQREDVARRDDVLGALGRIDRDRDGAGAVGRGDAGGDAVARLDRDGEGGLEARGVVLRHQRQAQLLAALAR